MQHTELSGYGFHAGHRPSLFSLVSANSSLDGFRVGCLQHWTLVRRAWPATEPGPRADIVSQRLGEWSFPGQRNGQNPGLHGVLKCRLRRISWWSAMWLRDQVNIMRLT